MHSAVTQHGSNSTRRRSHYGFQHVLNFSTRVESSQPTSRAGLVSTRVESSTRVRSVLRCCSVKRSVQLTRVRPVSNTEIFQSVKRPLEVVKIKGKRLMRVVHVGGIHTGCKRRNIYESARCLPLPSRFFLGHMAETLDDISSTDPRPLLPQ